MEFKASEQDKLKWAEFHSPEFLKTQMQVKRTMQDDLIKAIDELAEVETANAQRIKRLNESLKDSISENKRLILQKGIEMYGDKTVSSQLNDIVRILRNDIEKGYDLTKVKCTKKEFTSFIESKTQFAN